MKFPQNFFAGAGVLTAGAGVLTAGAGGEMTGVCTADNVLHFQPQLRLKWKNYKFTRKIMYILNSDLVQYLRSTGPWLSILSHILNDILGS